MLSDQTFVCLTPERWNGLWRNRHQLLTRFARHNRVLWVEPRPYLSEALHSMRARHLEADHTLAWPRPQHVQDGLFVYRDPLWLPLSGRPPLRQLTAWGRGLALRAAVRQIGGGQAPILWLFRPDQGDVIGQCGEQMVIYHAVDEYAAYEMEFQADQAANRPGRVQALEQIILRRADLVLVTSAPLLAAKQAWQPNTHLVPNGVDFAEFADALAHPQEPVALAAVPHPRLGFVGAINEKVDLRLLSALAAANRAWQIVLVGPVTLRYNLDDLAELRAQPNVHFVGALPVTQVPHAIAACDVCLMPYRINAWTHHISPLKLYEYLAIGRPIVSTAIPAVADMAPLVGMAPDAAAFPGQVELALRQAPDEAAAAARRQFAAGQTWDARVERISDLIVATLAGRSVNEKGD